MYRAEPTAAQMATYTRRLSTLPIEAVKHAVGRCLEELASLPTLADILKRCAMSVADQEDLEANAEWERVNQMAEGLVGRVVVTGLPTDCERCGNEGWFLFEENGSRRVRRCDCRKNVTVRRVALDERTEYALNQVGGFDRLREMQAKDFGYVRAEFLKSWKLKARASQPDWGIVE
jgi:hypothetical protein